MRSSVENYFLLDRFCNKVLMTQYTVIEFSSPCYIQVKKKKFKKKFKKKNTNLPNLPYSADRNGDLVSCLMINY